MGPDSKLNIGNGTGKIGYANARIISGAGETPGSVYTPIAAGTWSSLPNNYQAIGGTWNPNSKQFTVSDIQSGISGQTVTLNTSTLNDYRLPMPEPVGWLGKVFWPRPEVLR